MTDFENSPTATDDPKATKVSAFELGPTSLRLVITRDGHDSYARNKSAPRVGDIPPDYLAAINAWIAGGLR